MYSFSNGQTIKELFDNKNFQELVAFEKNADNLTADEIYMIGYAYYRLENDIKAIECYNKAIAKGLDNGKIYFYKGLSLFYMNRYDESLTEIEHALKLDPTNQEFMNEKGLIFFYNKQFDKALEVFEEAKKLPQTFPEPFYWIARIYHERQDFKKALSAYYDAINNLPKDNEYYVTSLICIGYLESNITKDYLKSAKAFAEVIQLDSENYINYYSLINSYNLAKEYKKADSIFNLVKVAFDNGKLPKEFMEDKVIGISKFEWNGQTARIGKSLITPEKTLDVLYYVSLFNKSDDKIVRKFQVEKSITMEKGGVLFILCEKDISGNGHKTYPYGWQTANVPIYDLESTIRQVLDGKMEPAATSSFSK